MILILRQAKQRMISIPFGLGCGPILLMPGRDLVECRGRPSVRLGCWLACC